MSDEFYGVCHVRNNALAECLSPALTRLPDGYEHPFAEPLRSQDCCVVMRHRDGSNGTIKAPPRRCRSRRRLWNPKAPEKAMRCCMAHTKLEAQARAWFAAGEAAQ